MSELFLTSSVHGVAKHLVKHLDLSKNNTLVFITTAAEPKIGDKTWLLNHRNALVEAGFNVSDYTITGKTIEQLTKDLTSFKYIYISGGDTEYLLRESLKSGFIKLIRDLVINQNKIYISTSAGSIAAGVKCPEYLLDDEEIIEGYGFVNFIVAPHWGRDDFKQRYLESRLKKAFKDTQIPIILLTDNQYIHVVNKMFEIIDINK